MNNQEMTAEQALNILDQATANAPLTRKDHTMVVMALQKLQAIINPTPIPHIKAGSVK